MGKKAAPAPAAGTEQRKCPNCSKHHQIVTILPEVHQIEGVELIACGFCSTCVVIFEDKSPRMSFRWGGGPDSTTAVREGVAKYRAAVAERKRRDEEGAQLDMERADRLKGEPKFKSCTVRDCAGFLKPVIDADARCCGTCGRRLAVHFENAKFRCGYLGCDRKDQIVPAGPYCTRCGRPLMAKLPPVPMKKSPVSKNGK